MENRVGQAALASVQSTGRKSDPKGEKGRAAPPVTLVTASYRKMASQCTRMPENSLGDLGIFRLKSFKHFLQMLRPVLCGDARSLGFRRAASPALPLRDKGPASSTHCSRE